MRWLLRDTAQLEPGTNLTSTDYPVLAARNEATLARFLPWGEALVAPACALEGVRQQRAPPLH